MAQGGPWALAALVITMVVTALVRGWLIPRSTHMDRVGDLKQTIARLEATVEVREQQINVLLSGARKDARP